MSSAIIARILVLDSDAASARLLSELLLGNGMHVDVTRECSHTLERAKQEFPDLIILNKETMSHGSSDIVRDPARPDNRFDSNGASGLPPRMSP